MIRYVGLSLLIALIAFDPRIAFCQSGAIFVWSSDIRQTEVRVKISGKLRKKVLYCRKKVPGTAKPVIGGYLYSSYRQLIKNLGSPRSAAGRAKLSNYKVLETEGTKACKAKTHPASTPTPGSGSGGTNFDANGNLTQSGKANFGVPQALWSLNGSVAAGTIYFQQNCSCHEDHGRNFSYTQLRAATSADPMYFSEESLPDAALMNLLAYLKRFQP